MLIRNLSFLLILASSLSHAMSTENLPETTLKAYGQSSRLGLEAANGNSSGSAPEPPDTSTRTARKYASRCP